MAWLESDTEGGTAMVASVQKAIDQKGFFQVVYHDALPANFDANRANIDVVTIDEALRPYTTAP